MEGNPGEEKPAHVEHHAESRHHSHGRRISPAFLITLGIIVVVAIAAILFFMLRGHGTVEKMNVTYSIALEDGTVIGSGTDEFIVGNVYSGIGLITAEIDSQISSMAAGDEKTLTLEPEDAYGKYLEALVLSPYNRTEIIERDSEIERTQTLTPDEFVQIFGEQPELGNEYELSGAPWSYKVVSKSDEEVEVESQAVVGTIIPYGVFDYEVTKVTKENITLRMQGNDSVIPADTYTIEIKFTDSSIITTITPEIGEWVELPDMPNAKVVDLDDDYIYLDANPDFAGERVTVTIKVNSRFTEKSSATGAAIVPGAPTMQVFIMSHCPYGTQIVKGLIPVMEKFKGIANVELRFVSYTMHGAQEELDNRRIACVREEQNSKLADYLECFVSSTGAESGIQACIAKLDKAKLEDCVENRADAYLADDNALNDKYGVRGSPTAILNGEEISVGRDSMSLATALCGAFSSKPSVCSYAFSSASPSAGFGSGSSTSSGSCG